MSYFEHKSIVVLHFHEFKLKVLKLDYNRCISTFYSQFNQTLNFKIRKAKAQPFTFKINSVWTMTLA